MRDVRLTVSKGDPSAALRMTPRGAVRENAGKMPALRIEDGSRFQVSGFELAGVDVAIGRV